MTTHYDTIIIGAGLSAIAAGIRLSHYNKKVLILEQHYLPGGLNSWYFHKGNYVDVGLHAVTNFARREDRQTPLNKLLRQLRFKYEDFDMYEQGFSTISFPDTTLRFTNDPQTLEDEIAQKFPSQIDGFRRLKNIIRSVDYLSLQAKPQSTRALIADYITEPLLVEMLLEPVMYYGSAQENDIEFNQFCIMFQSLFEEGFWRPAQGMKPFIEKLLSRYKENGGEIRMQAKVKSLNASADKIISLTLENGEILTADNFLSSAGANETFSLCADSNRPQLTHPDGQLSYIESIFMLDILPAEIGIQETISFYNQSNHFTYASPNDLTHLGSGVLCAPTNFQIPQDLQPKPSLRLTNLANFKHWNELTPEAYQEAKKTIQQSQQDFLFQKWPDLKGHIIDTDMFTPKTIVRFTGHRNGAIYGSPDKIREGITPYANLFLCGTDQGFLGIIGSMLSGVSITNGRLL